VGRSDSAAEDREVRVPDPEGNVRCRANSRHSDQLSSLGQSVALLADIGPAMLTFLILFGSTNTVARKGISVGLSRGEWLDQLQRSISEMERGNILR
jgi:hypothetical protein